MRIGSSTIGMESERTYSSVAGRVAKLTITNKRQGFMEGTGDLFGNLLPGEEGETDKAKDKETSEDYLHKTMEEMRAKLDAFRTGKIRNPELLETERELHSIRQQCLNYLMDILFPRRRFERYTENGTSSKDGKGDAAGGWTEAGKQNSATDSVRSAIGVNVRTITFSQQYYYEETENTSFSTKGTVKCADGREINFNLNLEMSRSFREYYEESYTMAEISMCDPLVINLDSNIAQLSDQTFFFDIDADGEMDEINRLAAGSGYLALDKNGDGIINDGSELFGTKSGNGFADLAAYDSDGNGFIDEGDEIWNKLKIWVMDENGEPQLMSLADKGVGAICLSGTPTDFALTGTDNALLGKIRNTGFFLYENGGAGSIQHVDLVKYDQAG